MKPYHSMDHETLEREYSPSSCIDDIMVFIKQYIDESKKAHRILKDVMKPDVKYGPEQRSNMDLFVPKSDQLLPIHVFIHGGYWQELSKNESAFAAPNFIGNNVIFIAFDYTLAPEANLFEIVDQTKRGILSILKNAKKFGGDADNITISGSSAGGHLVAEILSTKWQDYGYRECPIKGALCISGVFDLEPIVNTYINEQLKMTKEDAYKLSPLYHIPHQSCPIIFSIGENETSEFHRQNDEYMLACKEKGIETSLVEMPGFNHFDIALDLNNRDSPLFQAVLNQIKA